MKTSLLIDRVYGRDPRIRYTDERFYWAEILGRLKPGVTLAQAQAALGPLFHNYVSDLANTDEERKTLPGLVVKGARAGSISFGASTEAAVLPYYAVGLILASLRPTSPTPARARRRRRAR